MFAPKAGPSVVVLTKRRVKPGLELGGELRDRLLRQPASFGKKKEYALQEELGRGAFGRVMLARWRPVDGPKRDVALKIIQKKDGEVPLEVLDEINVLKELDHPNIVHLYDVFESRDKYYLAFELAVGGCMFDRILERGKFTERDGVDCIRQILSATAYLHARRIVHRDLKSQNVLYKTAAPDSPLVLADFGIAKPADRPDEAGFTYAGTWGYIAPEMLQGRGYGDKVDCWSVGVIAYRTLSGYEPFRAAALDEHIAEMTVTRVSFHEAYWKKISMTARDFIRRLLEPDPAKRMSADEALRHPWLAEGPSPGRDTDLSSHIRENFDVRRTWSGALSVVKAANAFRRSSLTPSSSSSTSPYPDRALTPFSATEDEDDESDGDTYHTADSDIGSAPVTPMARRRPSASSSRPRLSRDSPAPAPWPAPALGTAPVVVAEPEAMHGVTARDFAAPSVAADNGTQVGSSSASASASASAPTSARAGSASAGAGAGAGAVSAAADKMRALTLGSLGSRSGASAASAGSASGAEGDGGSEGERSGGAPMRKAKSWVPKKLW
ncbi:Calmodulin-dependent protein kinase cmk2 [Cryptotrichosporon argae]